MPTSYNTLFVARNGMTSKLRVILHELQDELVRVYGSRLHRIVLFGSRARHEAVEGSDVDVLVVLEGEVDPGVEISRTGASISALSLKYDEVVSCVFMSALRYQDERSPLLLNVRREGVQL